MIRLLEETDRKAHNQLAEHVLQSWEWAEFKTQNPGVSKAIRLGSFTGAKLIRSFQILIHKLPAGLTLAYVPRGPVPNAKELSEIRSYLSREKSIALRIDPYPAMKILGGGVEVDPIQPRHTIYIDLTSTEENMLSSMHEKTRYNVRLAQKKGVIVREDGEEKLEDFIRILEDTEKRQHFYAHDADYYRKLWKVLRPAKMVHLLSAYEGNDLSGKPIASIMLFKFKDFLYYPYGGFDYEMRAFMAPQLLHFEAMKLGKKLGCKTYDLWGSYQKSAIESDPWWGFYRIKAGLGGKEIDLGPSFDLPILPLYQTYRFAESFRRTLLKIGNGVR